MADNIEEIPLKISNSISLAKIHLIYWRCFCWYNF